MEKKVKLDFVLVGGAKCGTTSVSEYLQEHPDICMPRLKDMRLRFLGFPIDKVAKYYYANVIESVDDYMRLFKDCSKEKTIGETNVHYLYLHEKSIPFIKMCHGDTKIIIMLRNPIKRAFSSYTMMKRDMREKLSFYEALHEEGKRIKAGNVIMWHYKGVGMYYEQVKAYMSNFTNVKVVLLDDLAKDPEGTMEDIFRFVGVDPLFRPQLEKRHNISGIPKSKILQKVYVLLNFVKQVLYPPMVRDSRVYVFLSSLIPDNIKAIPQTVYRKNLVKDTQIDAKSWKYLEDYFREDVEKLSSLLDRDLSDWLRR